MPTDLAKLQRMPHQVARWQSAQQQLLSHHPAQALSAYRNLVERFPGIPQLWVELGMAAAGELDFTLAEQGFSRAQQLAPGDSALLLVLAQQYQRLRRPERATACFEKAAAADPHSLPARLSLAAWYERQRRLDEAWRCLEQCDVRHRGNPELACAQALLLHRLGRNSEAEALLRAVVNGSSQNPSLRFSSRHLLALVLDALGNYEEALKCLLEGKAQAPLMVNTAKMERDYDRADQRRRQLLAELTPAMLQRWREQGDAVPVPGKLAFLGGHPRSGTTLLEQVLAAHPSLLAFDEPESFAEEIWHALAPMDAAHPLTAAQLDALPAPQRRRLGERYLKSLLRSGGLGETKHVLLDKNPSPTAALHLWLRIFPHLRVVIALRDPRDVVLSCFFQNLMLTPTNVNFLSLERTAKHYADLMDVWRRLRELGQFEWLETRYEDLVVSMETEGNRVTQFLGLTWTPAQAQYHKAAQPHVFSPTYSEAAQPVYRRAIGRWHHYAAALEPLQPRLEPYCRAFGYGG